MSEKQDRHGARTVSDLERKYAFGKSFAEAYGLANDARETAKGVQQDLKDMFAKDITMTGSFRSSAEAYLPPTYQDAVDTLWAVFHPATHPLPTDYDFDLNGDGTFDEEDAILALSVVRGTHKMEDLPGAVKTKVTITIDMSDPVKTILISGKNMWGTLIETYIGADMFNSSFVAKDSLKTIIQTDSDGSTYRFTDDGQDIKEYFNPPMELDVEYRTTERWLGKVVYTKLIQISSWAAVGSRTFIQASPDDTTIHWFYGYAVREDTGDMATMPFVDTSGNHIAKMNVSEWNQISLWTIKSGATSYTPYVQVKYTYD